MVNNQGREKERALPALLFAAARRGDGRAQVGRRSQIVVVLYIYLWDNLINH